jgi:large subunit ribosomal protein L18e
MKSKTLIEKQSNRKTSYNLVNAITLAKKNDKWQKIAGMLSSPRKTITNLSEIEKFAKKGETIVVPGKVLSQGEITKKIKVIAFAFSQNAKEKLLNAKCEVLDIIDEIKKNPKAEKIKLMGEKR